MNNQARDFDALVSQTLTYRRLSPNQIRINQVVNRLQTAVAIVSATQLPPARIEDDPVANLQIMEQASVLNAASMLEEFYRGERHMDAGDWAAYNTYRIRYNNAVGLLLRPEDKVLADYRPRPDDC